MADDTRSMLRGIPSLQGSAPDVEVGALPADPIALFLRWLDDAVRAEVAEPHVMTLSTVDGDDVPDARVLVLKDVDERGWAFAGLASSAKGRQLAGSPAAALSFWWQPHARAIRLRGRVVAAPREESLADLRARPAAGQAGVDPDDWTLWRLQPTHVEFWQGAKDRKHLRLHYTLGAAGWELTPPVP